LTKQFSLASLLAGSRRQRVTVGLHIGESTLQLAAVSHAGGTPVVQRCLILPLGASDSLREQLGAQISAMGLKGSVCNCLLPGRDYNLYLLEAPDVPADEMRQAVRWKVKDLLDMPADEAVIDVFPLPEDAFPGRARMVYLVAAARNRIEQLVALITGAGLQLSRIDIAELALRNVFSRSTDDSNGLAVLALQGGSSCMNISRESQLYMTRRINTRIEAGAPQTAGWEEVLDRLVLEIQRSLDYYESQMGQSPIARVQLLPRGEDDQTLVDALNGALAVSVSLMDINAGMAQADKFDGQTLLSCMGAVAVALGEGSE